jgi:hypothetical protein
MPAPAAANIALFRGAPLNRPIQPPAPRVAIIHYWLVSMRGGEKVLEALCRNFPQADIFTHVYDPQKDFIDDPQAQYRYHFHRFFALGAAPL